jgi:hypothetical protein
MKEFLGDIEAKKAEIESLKKQQQNSYWQINQLVEETKKRLGVKWSKNEKSRINSNLAYPLFTIEQKDTTDHSLTPNLFSVKYLHIEKEGKWKRNWPGRSQKENWRAPAADYISWKKILCR